MTFLMLAVVAHILCAPAPAFAQQSQDPTLLNGGSILAMAGRDCVALAVDRRFGSGSALVSVQSRRSLLLPSDRCLVGFTGLQSDVETLQEELLTLVASKYSTGISVRSCAAPSKARTGISPRSMASLASHVLYGRRRSPYYVEPVVVGLERHEDGENGSADSSGCRYRPYLCSMDVIGATSLSHDFVCGGAATASLYGTAEAFWRPGMDRDELLEVICMAFVTALERDCLSGYGALVYILTADGITEYDISTRED
jgi:20S proteasome subunit beta 3